MIKLVRWLPVFLYLFLSSVSHACDQPPPYAYPPPPPYGGYTQPYNTQPPDATFTGPARSQSSRSTASGFSYRTSQRTTAEGYHLDIHFTGIKPDDIAIKAKNHTLFVSVDRTEKNQQNRPGNYSYSYSSASFSKRISIPADANIVEMKIERSKNIVTVTLPRK